MDPRRGEYPPQFVVTVKFFGRMFTMHQLGYPSVDQIVDAIIHLPHWSRNGQIFDEKWTGSDTTSEAARLIAQDLSDWFSLDPVESEDLMEHIAQKYLFPRRTDIGPLAPRNLSLVELLRLGGKLSDYIFIHHVERIDGLPVPRESEPGSSGSAAGGAGWG